MFWHRKAHGEQAEYGDRYDVPNIGRACAGELEIFLRICLRRFGTRKFSALASKNTFSKAKVVLMEMMTSEAVSSLVKINPS